MEAHQSSAAQAGQYLLALEALGLEWHWDATEPVRHYIEREHPHLLRAYDADFLVNAIEAARRRVAA